MLKAATFAIFLACIASCVALLIPTTRTAQADLDLVKEFVVPSEAADVTTDENETILPGSIRILTNSES